MTRLLTNATVVSLNPPALRTAHVVIDRGVVADVATERPNITADDLTDCSSLLLLPGNVCAHTHLYSTLARGMPAPRVPPSDFVEILEHVWWPLDRSLNDAAIRSSALVGALDAVRAGTTTLFDHHASPNCTEGSLDIIADAVERVGLRAVLCYEVSDRDGPIRAGSGLHENDRFMRENRRPLVRGCIGAHASFTLHDDTLSRVSEMARHHGTGAHIHVAEDSHDQRDAQRRSGVGVVERLDRAGIFTESSLAAHGVHLSHDEVGRLQARNTWLVHNCRSNMNNGVGRAPVRYFGVRTALGTDGIDGDMFAESRTAFFRTREESLSYSAEQCVSLVSQGSALASQYFGTSIGSIVPGAQADLIALRYDPPSDMTADNFAWHWLFGLSSQHVDSVMVGGEWILQGGRFPHLDEERIRAEARHEARRLWTRMEET